ncbi:MAG: ArsC family reductase [Alphaproteobacteria bacterium]
MLTIHGIRTCDSCKKAIRWAQEKGIDHSFHDWRNDGLDEDQLDMWLLDLGWEQVLNKRSTSWRELPKEVQNAVDADMARTLLIGNPTLIKRPLFTLDGSDEVVLGFTKDSQSALNRMLAGDEEGAL